MVQYRLGYFATSLCGHDKGRLYMIVSEEDNMVGLCDGIHRCLDNPKRKKKKHVQMMRHEETADHFPELIKLPDADRRIREAVIAVRRESNGETKHPNRDLQKSPE